MINRRKFTASIALLAGMAGLLPLSVQAQEKLDLATIVVGFPPGGGTDSVARVIADALTGTYADAVVVENRPGASGRIGAAYVKSSPPDGSVLFFTPSFPLVISPHLYQEVPYDPLTDFAPVATSHFGLMALSVGPAVPETVTDIKSYLEWVKENPDKAQFGAPAGSSQHFTGLLLAQASGVELELIAYPGGAPSVVDALGGHVPAIITPLSEVLPYAADGSLRILAGTGPERTPLAADVATFTEQGLDVVVQNWSGFLAPANTPAAVVSHANQAISEAVMRPDVVKKLADIGNEAHAVSVSEFEATLKSDFEKYGQIIKDTGFTVEQ